MLAYRERGSGNRTIFFLHLLGGSGREWSAAGPFLEDRFRCVYIDLPGFGASAQVEGYDVQAMTSAVAETIVRCAAAHWMLVAHSMGAKVAAALCRRSEDGDAGMRGLEGLAFFAGSPPSPEPMADSRRATMLGWFTGSVDQSRAEALDFIETNAALPIDPRDRADAIEDVLRANRSAWIAWLEGGSREDWSARIGVLQTPALIVAGERDADLGPDAQHALMVPHFTRVRVETIAGAKHLLPLEAASDVARLIAEAFKEKAPVERATPLVPPSYRALIESDRVSIPTRNALLQRAQPDDLAYQPRTLTAGELLALRALVECIVPQRPSRRIDLAVRIDQRLSTGNGDGWRHASLPSDADAYRAGLRTLDRAARRTYGNSFASLDEGERERLLEVAAKGELADTVAVGESLDPHQMRLWFEDVRGEAVRLYVAHPATLASMGFSGIADGAEAATAQGFVALGIGAREAWEPTSDGEPA